MANQYPIFFIQLHQRSFFVSLRHKQDNHYPHSYSVYLSPIHGYNPDTATKLFFGCQTSHHEVQAFHFWWDAIALPASDV